MREEDASLTRPRASGSQGEDRFGAQRGMETRSIRGRKAPIGYPLSVPAGWQWLRVFQAPSVHHRFDRRDVPWTSGSQELTPGAGVLSPVLRRSNCLRSLHIPATLPRRQTLAKEKELIRDRFRGARHIGATVDELSKAATARHETLAHPASSLGLGGWAF